MSGPKGSATASAAHGDEVGKGEAQKRCPQCKFNFPRSMYSHSGWSGRGWCKNCRDKYSRQTAQRRSLISAELKAELANGAVQPKPEQSKIQTRRPQRIRPTQPVAGSAPYSRIRSNFGGDSARGGGVAKVSSAAGTGSVAGGASRSDTGKRARTTAGEHTSASNGASATGGVRARKMSRTTEGSGWEGGGSWGEGGVRTYTHARTRDPPQSSKQHPALIEETDEGWRRNCVPFLGARVRVRTMLGAQNSEMFENATVAAYLPPTWQPGGGVEGPAEEALWRVAFDHPYITPQDLDVDELLAAAALYTSHVRRRLSLSPVQKALSEEVTSAAAAAAGKGGMSCNGRSGGGKGVECYGGVGSGIGGSVESWNPKDWLDAGGGGAERVGVGDILDGRANRMDMEKLKTLDLESMFVLRVLPDYGEAVGEVIEKGQDDMFEVHYENGSTEKLDLLQLAASLRDTMSLAHGDGWGSGRRGLAQRICPTPAEVATARQDLLKEVAAGGSAGGVLAWRNSRNVTRELNGVLLRQDRGNLHLQVNDSVLCECNGYLLDGKVCQLKPGKAKVHLCGTRQSRDLWLDLTSPRLLLQPPKPRKSDAPFFVASIRKPGPVNFRSISGAEDRRHFATVREALGLHSLKANENEESESWMAETLAGKSSLNSAGFRVPASKKVPLSALVVKCKGVPTAALKSSHQSLQQVLETAAMTPPAPTPTQFSTFPGESSASVTPATVSTVNRAVPGDFTVRSKPHVVPVSSASPTSREQSIRSAGPGLLCGLSGLGSNLPIAGIGPGPGGVKDVCKNLWMPGPGAARVGGLLSFGAFA